MTIQSVEDIINLAGISYNNGEFIQSADYYFQAAIFYKSQNNFILSAEMKNNQSVALLLGKQGQNALEACLGTAEFFLENNEEKRAGVAYANEAAAYQAINEFQIAEERYKQAANILNSIGEKEMYAQIFHSLSQLQLRMGKQFDALTSMKTNLENTEDTSFKKRLLKFLLNIRKILLP
jgi:tetratricopeptide (TPR) repeat protein